MSHSDDLLDVDSRGHNELERLPEVERVLLLQQVWLSQPQQRERDAVQSFAPVEQETVPNSQQNLREVRELFIAADRMRLYCR